MFPIISENLFINYVSGSPNKTLPTRKQMSKVECKWSNSFVIRPRIKANSTSRENFIFQNFLFQTEPQRKRKEKKKKEDCR